MMAAVFLAPAESEGFAATAIVPLGATSQDISMVANTSRVRKTNTVPMP